MNKLQFGVLLAAILIGAGGCKAFKGKTNKENIEPPTELVDFDPTLAVDRLWSNGIGKGERKLGIRQSPALAGGRVYAASPSGELVAMDAASGKQLWSLKGDQRWSGGPTVAEGTLIAGTLEGDVVAFNPETGAERWRARASSEIISPPAIGQGVAVVRANDGRLFGYSITTGERRWVYERGIPSLTLRGNGRPVIEGGAVFVGYDGGVVVALKLDDGRLLWEQSVAESKGRTELERMVDIDGDIVVAGSEVYVASFNSQIAALDAGSGRPLWTREMSVYGGVNLAGDRLLVSDVAGTVWALDRRSGAAMWRNDELAHRYLTTPVAINDHVVVGDLEGYLHWLALADGKLAAREKLAGDPIRATPQTSTDAVYAVTVNGQLSAYRAGR